MAMTTENPNEENIKCVIVGDNNVGKTRLVCARAYKRYEPNDQYSKYGSTHIPTVWANDHYRNDADVLKKARDNIGGVTVSLRLWDTFGDHSKNRKFSYGRADVVIICFSICDTKSLEHVKSFWLPEVRRHCKCVPVLVVACRIDLRFANIEDLNKRKTSLAKRIKSSDILYPQECRQVANDAGCPYYETSICKGFGVKEVFENAVRAALVHRKRMYMYRNVHLRHVQKPMLQKPLTPPKPDPPLLPEKVAESLLDFSRVYNDPTHSDLLIVGKGFKFHAHKVILATASKVFRQIFSALTIDVYVIPTNDEENLLSSDLAHEDQKVPDLIPLPPQSTGGKCQFPEFERESLEQKIEMNFVSKYECKQASNCCADVLSLTPDVSEFSLMNIMHFCYMGRLSPEISEPNWLKSNIQQFTDLLSTSRRFGLSYMADLLIGVFHGEPGMAYSLKKYDIAFKETIRDLVLSKTLYSDIEFEADDGSVPGHKALLVCGSELMSAMFGSSFKESGNKVVSFPGTTVQSLQTALEYIYTRKVTSLGNSTIDYMDIIALANRFCLSELICIVETHAIKEFEGQSSVVMTRELHENVVQMLEVAQLHNANVLAEWCFYHITTNYNDVCKRCKMVKCLSQENQEHLEQRRWPPVWFIKDYDTYERACDKRALEPHYPRGKSAKKSY